MSTMDSADYGSTGYLSALERIYIEEYLQSKGYCLKDLQAQPKKEVKRLMIEACTYTSFKLAELESRAKFRKKIHFK
jgi:hypothetical protein